MADWGSTMTVMAGGYGQAAEVWSESVRRVTVILSVSSVVGQFVGGGATR